MIITINGKITAALSPRRGTAKTGNEWVSQDFVIETENGDCICFNMFGEDKILNSGLKVGAIASVTCDVKSKEWNGKWFTSASCVNCIVQGAAQPQQVPSAHAQAPVQPQPQPQHSSISEIDHLPF